MRCNEFISQIDAYLNETMDGDNRRSFRDHLKECSSCRDEALKIDPALLFAVSRKRETPANDVESCVVAVQALIRQDRLRRKMKNPLPRWTVAAAACLTLILGGSVVWHQMPFGGDAVAERQESAVVGDAEDAGGSTIEPPRVEVDMTGEDIRVYQFAQEHDDNTAVCFIVNKAMEL